MKPKALFFDVGGTIFDWKKTVRQKLPALVSVKLSDAEILRFADHWRATFFEVREEVAHGYQPWMNSDGMQNLALERLKASHEFLNEIENIDAFSKLFWHDLAVFDGAKESIKRLRTKHVVSVLTILSWESIVHSSKRRGVIWDGILSCEFLGNYKPSFQAYVKACELLGLSSSEVMMVAAHPADLAAAKMTGMKTALVQSNKEGEIFTSKYIPDDAYHFDLKVKNFEELCLELDC